MARPCIDGDDYIPSFLSHLNNRLSSGASQLYLKHFGVGINEWRILSVLSNMPDSTAAHICDTVAMHKTVASRSAREMALKGLLTIDGSGRVQTMRLTRQGQAMHDRIAAIALQREKLLVDGFTAEEREQLVGFLRRMLANMPTVDAWDPMADQPSGRRKD